MCWGTLAAPHPQLPEWRKLWELANAAYFNSTGFSFFFFFFFGLQDSCLFLSSKKAFRTPDEPEMRRNNGLVCLQ